MEYGTRSTAQIMGIGEAIKFMNKIGVNKIIERGNNLAKSLKEELSKIKNIEIISPMNEEYASSIVSFRMKNIGYQALQLKLKAYDIRVRGIYENNLNAIRVSCAVYNNLDEIKALISAIKQIDQALIEEKN